MPRRRRYIRPIEPIKPRILPNQEGEEPDLQEAKPPKIVQPRPGAEPERKAA